MTGVPLIAFGGVSETSQIEELLASPNVVAAAVGNFLNYTEHSVQHLKRGLVSAPLRPPTYAGSAE
jgi:cyclase